MPTGGGYSYHATAGTGYGPPAHPVVHPKPVAGTGGGGGKKGLFGGGSGKKGSLAMSALTLLSFLFFINLLQGCIKDHMDAMNPTVMVMTTNVIRNRFNKMGEMNSREQKPPASNIASVMHQAPDLTVAAAAAQANSVLQTPYSNNVPTNPYNKPLQPPAPPPSPPPPQPQPQYPQPNPEAEIPLTYAKPSFYDPLKPDAYDQMIQLPAPQQTFNFNNHSYYNTPTEQTYTYHHTAYNAQTITKPQPQQQAPPSRPFVSSQYSVNQNPFYEHQYPVTSKPFSSDTNNSPYAPEPQDYTYRQPQQIYTPSVSPNNAYPWSTNLHTSSVVSGPYRRASIISVSPKTKWISVPAKITDRTNFNLNSRLEESEEEVIHHDDRDLFRSRN